MSCRPIYLSFEEGIAWISWGCLVTSPICHSATALYVFFYFCLSYVWRSSLLLSWWTHKENHLEGFSLVVLWKGFPLLWTSLKASVHKNLGILLCLARERSATLHPLPNPRVPAPWWTIDVYPESWQWYPVPLPDSFSHETAIITVFDKLTF